LNLHKELIIAVLLANPDEPDSIADVGRALDLQPEEEELDIVEQEEEESNPIGDEEQTRRKYEFLNNFAGRNNPLQNAESKRRNKSAPSPDTAVDQH
jgi:hypothetical protein